MAIHRNQTRSVSIGNIVGGDGLTARLPLVVGFAKAMELIITGRRIDVLEAERLGLVNEIVPKGRALQRAQEMAHEIAALPQPLTNFPNRSFQFPLRNNPFLIIQLSG